MTIDTLSHEIAIGKCKELAALVDQRTVSKGNGAHATAIDSLLFMRECSPSTAIQGVSEPLLAVVVQGKKEGVLNEETYQYGEDALVHLACKDAIGEGGVERTAFV